LLLWRVILDHGGSCHADTLAEYAFRDWSLLAPSLPFPTPTPSSSSSSVSSNAASSSASSSSNKAEPPAFQRPLITSRASLEDVKKLVHQALETTHQIPFSLLYELSNPLYLAKPLYEPTLPEDTFSYHPIAKVPLSDVFIPLEASSKSSGQTLSSNVEGENAMEVTRSVSDNVDAGDVSGDVKPSVVESEKMSVDGDVSLSSNAAPMMSQESRDQQEAEERQRTQTKREERFALDLRHVSFKPDPLLDGCYTLTSNSYAPPHIEGAPDEQMNSLVSVLLPIMEQSGVGLHLDRIAQLVIAQWPILQPYARSDINVDMITHAVHMTLITHPKFEREGGLHDECFRIVSQSRRRRATHPHQQHTPLQSTYSPGAGMNSSSTSTHPTPSPFGSPASNHHPAGNPTSTNSNQNFAALAAAAATGGGNNTPGAISNASLSSPNPHSSFKSSPFTSPSPSTSLPGAATHTLTSGPAVEEGKVDPTHLKGKATSLAAASKRNVNATANASASSKREDSSTPARSSTRIAEHSSASASPVVGASSSLASSSHFSQLPSPSGRMKRKRGAEKEYLSKSNSPSASSSAAAASASGSTKSSSSTSASGGKNSSVSGRGGSSAHVGSGELLSVSSTASHLHPSVAFECAKYYGSVQVLTARLRPGPGYNCNTCKTKKSERWFHGPNPDDWHCAQCGETWSIEHTCPICGLVYENDDDDLVASSSSDEEDVEDAEEEDEDVEDDEDEDVDLEDTHEDVEHEEDEEEEDEEEDDDADADEDDEEDEDDESLAQTSQNKNHTKADKEKADAAARMQTDAKDAEEDAGKGLATTSTTDSTSTSNRQQTLNTTFTDDSTQINSTNATDKSSAQASTGQVSSAIGEQDSNVNKPEGGPQNAQSPTSATHNASAIEVSETSATGDDDSLASSRASRLNASSASSVGKKDPSLQSTTSSMELDTEVLPKKSKSAKDLETSESSVLAGGGGDDDFEQDETGDESSAAAVGSDGSRKKRKRRKSTFRKSTYPKASKSKAMRTKSLIANSLSSSPSNAANGTGKSAGKAKSSKSAPSTSKKASSTKKASSKHQHKHHRHHHHGKNGARGGASAKKGKGASSSSGSNSGSGNSQSSWIACDECNRWVMSGCDGITDLSLYDDANPNHLDYRCPLCRGNLYAMPSVFYTRSTAKFFVGDLKEAKKYVSSGEFLRDINAVFAGLYDLNSGNDMHFNGDTSATSGLGGSSSTGNTRMEVDPGVSSKESPLASPPLHFTLNSKQVDSVKSSTTAASASNATSTKSKQGARNAASSAAAISNAHHNNQSHHHTPTSKGISKHQAANARNTVASSSTPSSLSPPAESSKTRRGATTSNAVNAAPTTSPVGAGVADHNGKSLESSTGASGSHLQASNKTLSPSNNWNTAFVGAAAAIYGEGTIEAPQFAFVHPQTPIAHLTYGMHALSTPVFVLNAQLAAALDPNAKFNRMEQEMLRSAETTLLTQQQQLKAAFDVAMMQEEEKELKRREQEQASADGAKANRMDVSESSTAPGTEGDRTENVQQTKENTWTSNASATSSGTGATGVGQIGSRPLPPLSDKSKHTLALLEQRFQEEVLNMRSLLANSMAHMMDQHRLDSERAIYSLLQEREQLDSQAEKLILEQFQQFAANKTQHLLAKTLALYQQECPALLNAALPSLQHTPETSNGSTSNNTNNGNAGDVAEKQSEAQTQIEEAKGTDTSAQHETTTMQIDN